METGAIRKMVTSALLLFALPLQLALTAKFATAQLSSTQHILPPTYFPEQRNIQVRDPSQLPRYDLPDLPSPPTVTNRTQDLEPRYITLDEAIRTALGNARVVRVLAGTTAVASGSTIYDAALTNTSIDRENARFDPTVTVNQSFNRLESPFAVPDPLDPANRSLITGTGNQNYNLGVGVTKQNAYGGTAALDVTSNTDRLSPGIFPLNPATRSSAGLSYTQPLLQGGRLAPNLAPIMLARIDTERSYFQLKDTVQEQVRGVIEAYWNLVFARTDVWARRQQVDRLKANVKLLQAKRRVGIGNRPDVAQIELALANAQANVVSSEANVLQREAALRNILGLPPSDHSVYVPVTPPINDQFVADWPSIVQIAQQRRPDLVELKLILEADNQLLIQANNNALPKLDAVALYRWNGLEGEMPNGGTLRSGPGQFTDWTLGVNFSVPIGLRAGRAGLRRVELLIARDRANLDQGMHAMIHSLATNVRSLDTAYENYAAFKLARAAAEVNLDYQEALFNSGQGLLLNYLVAVAEWGNSISSEANALAGYNTQLATLEQQTGTILETHGVVLYEERYGSIGPLGRFASDVCYPLSNPPTPNDERYGGSDEPAEESFNLVLPSQLGDGQRRLPSPENVPNPAPLPAPSTLPIPTPIPLPPAPALPIPANPIRPVTHTKGTLPLPSRFLPKRILP
ncbi:MAG: TolC family protein [Pirellulaceae bacterium]|nr:TolC family protein [Pirellulaceae bacterium]